MPVLERGPGRPAGRPLRLLALLLLLAACSPLCHAQMDFTGVRRDLAVGATPRTIAAGDLNGDGLQDLVVVAGSSNAVSILLNAGDGVFRAATEVATAECPNAAVLARFNGDAYLDMAVASYLGNQIQIYLGNGAGGFSGPTSVPTGLGSGPWALAVLDYNDDTKNDLAAVLYGTSQLVLYTGNGTGGFTIKGAFSVPLHPVALTVGDWGDADGLVDVAVVSEGDTSVNPPPAGTVSVRYGDAALGFSAYEFTFDVNPVPASIASGLLNGDTYPDLVTGSIGSDSISVLYGNFEEGFTDAVPLDVGDPSFTAVVGDFNDDAARDIAVSVQRSSGQGAVRIYSGNGLGAFAEGGTFAIGSIASDVAAVDFAGSAALDLATANTSAASVSLLIGDGAGAFTATPRYSLPPYSYVAGLAAADMNGNGTVDLAVARRDGTGTEPDSLVLLQGSGTGTFSAWQSLPLDCSPDGEASAGPVLFAPFVGGDDHGDLAILLGGMNNDPPPAVQVFPGDGGGVFGAGTSYGLGYECVYDPKFKDWDCLDPQAITAAPLDDSDTSHPDLAVTVLGGDETFPYGFVSVLLQSGGSLGPATRYAPWSGYCAGGADPGAACTVNTDCPGLCSGAATPCWDDLDCVSPETCTNPSPGTCEPLEMGPTGIAAGLVDGDADRDLLVCGSTSDKAAFLPGSGAGAFSMGTLTETGPTPQWPILADLDGDLDQDLAVVNCMGSSVSVYLGDDAGNFTPHAEVPGLRFPYRGLIADMNLDGWDDLVVGNLSMGTVSVLLGDGTGHFGAPVHLGVGDTPRYITTADHNGDGKPDLATSDGGDGTVSILLNASQDPVLTLTGAGSSTTASWQAMFEASSYDVIRGLVSGLTQTDTQVSLGAVTCVENDSPDPLTTDAGVPPLGAAYFYLMRTQDPYVKGSYGRSSLGKVRVPASGDCL